MKGNKFQIPLHTSKAKDSKMSQKQNKRWRKGLLLPSKASSNQKVSPRNLSIGCPCGKRAPEFAKVKQTTSQSWGWCENS